MKRMFGIFALMVVASIMIAGCVQPGGNETVTPTPTSGVTETPVGTETTEETPMATATTMETETTATTMGTGTTATTETTATTMETETTATNVTETPPAPPAAGEETISITDSGFVPDDLTVSPDTTVTWTNNAATNQTILITGPTGSVDLGTIEQGDSSDYTFTAEGSYAYRSDEAGYTGTVTVTENTTA